MEPNCLPSPKVGERLLHTMEQGWQCGVGTRACSVPPWCPPSCWFSPREPTWVAAESCRTRSSCSGLPHCRTVLDHATAIATIVGITGGPYSRPQCTAKNTPFTDASHNVCGTTRFRKCPKSLAQVPLNDRLTVMMIVSHQFGVTHRLTDALNDYPKLPREGRCDCSSGEEERLRVRCGRARVAP
jgi:hypothetical protein